MMTQDLKGCTGYINAMSACRSHPQPPQLPAIAISRETGTDARTIARLAADLLDAKDPHAECPWATFDRELVEKVIEDHGLSDRIRRFMPEDSIPELKDAVEEMLGLHPSQWKLVHYTTDTIRRLSKAGNAIIIGRGAPEITARMRHVLKVRLIAPIEKRISRVAESEGLSRHEAADFIQKKDRARNRYVAHNFNAKIDDPLQYHLTLNLGLLSNDVAAGLIADATVGLKSLAEAV